MFSIGPQDKLPVAASAYLLPGEQVLDTVRKHPAVLAGAFLLMLGSLLAAVVLSTTVARPYPPVILILWGLWLITAGYCLWRFVNWSVTFFIITEYRLLLITGVFDTEVGMM